MAVQSAKNQNDKVFSVNVISGGDPLEIYTDREGEVIFKKYSPIGELASFAGGRVLTLLLQEAMFVVFFHWLGISEFIVKIIAAVLVVIANYFISKLIVFKNKNEK